MVCIPLVYFEAQTGLHAKYETLGFKNRVISLVKEPHNFILSAASSFYKLEVFKSLRFDERMLTAEDTKVNLQVLRRTMHFGYVCENGVTYNYRRRNNGSSNVDAITSGANKEALLAPIYIFEDLYPKEGYLAPYEKELLAYELRSRLRTIKKKKNFPKKNFRKYNGPYPSDPSVVINAVNDDLGRMFFFHGARLDSTQVYEFDETFAPLLGGRDSVRGKTSFWIDGRLTDSTVPVCNTYTEADGSKMLSATLGQFVTALGGEKAMTQAMRDSIASGMSGIRSRMEQFSSEEIHLDTGWPLHLFFERTIYIDRDSEPMAAAIVRRTWTLLSKKSKRKKNGKFDCHETVSAVADPARCSSIRTGSIACRGPHLSEKRLRHRMCRGRPAAITEKIREIDRPPRCFPEDESQRSFPIRRNRLRSLLACTVSGTYPQVHSGGESGVDVGLSRNTAHLRMHLFGKRVWHRFERRYSGLAEAGNFQPVAHGLLPEKNRTKRSS